MITTTIEWYSCDEKLPKPYTDLIICPKNKDSGIEAYYTWGEYFRAINDERYYPQEVEYWTYTPSLNSIPKDIKQITITWYDANKHRPPNSMKPLILVFRSGIIISGCYYQFDKFQPPTYPNSWTALDQNAIKYWAYEPTHLEVEDA